jgi:apolipoprotein N-acyltransferase
MQGSAVAGIVGINALAVFVFAMPAIIAGRRHKALGLTVATLLVAADLGYGYVRLATPLPAAQKHLALRIVQPSIDQSEKWDAGVRDRIFKNLLDLSRQPPAQGQAVPQLILWPETSVPFLFSERPDGLSAIGEMLGDGQMLLAGAVRNEDGGAGGPQRYYNSVVAIDDRGEIVDAVDKVHLVPFGEYLPFSGLLGALGLEKIVETPLDFSAGSSRHAITFPGGLRGLPFVCYEIIFPDLVADDATSTDILVNVTNDAWFGNTPGPYQHLRQAQLRAVETGLPLIRAANDGISAVVDARGRILDALAVDARGVIDLSLPVATQRPANWNNRVNGLVIIFALGLLALGWKLAERLKPN